MPAGETVYRSADTVILYVADNPDSPEEEEEEKSSSSEYVYRSQQGTMETAPISTSGDPLRMRRTRKSNK